jgi:PAS domain S-box-containing protein
MGIDVFEVLGRYTPVLLATAFILAVAASQAILILADRVYRTYGLTGWGWLVSSSLIIGLTVWSVDLLRQISLIPVAYYRLSSSLWFLAAVLSILACAWWLAVHRLRQPLPQRLLAAVLLTAPAFATVHLLIRAATGEPLISGDLMGIASALGIAALTSGLLFFASARFSSAGSRRIWWRLLSALVITGVFIAGFHQDQQVSDSGWLQGAPLPDDLVISRDSAVAWSIVVLAALISLAIGAHIDRRVRRQHAETAALRRSEDRFRSLAQASAQIVWTTTPDGEMRGEQPSWSDFTGQTRESYGGAGWFNAIHPEDREETARIWEETLGKRTSAEFQHRLRRHDGQFRKCVVRVVPVLDRDSSVREWVGTHTDISERSRIEEERDILSEVGKILSSSLDFRETLGTVARLLVPRISTWCAVDMLADDRTMQRVASAHHDPRVAELLRNLNLSNGSETERAMAQRVLQTGESVLCRRSSDDLTGVLAANPDHRAALEGLDLSSVLWVPLSSRGQVLGVLTLVSAREGRQYDFRDLALAEELGRRSANAVDNARLYARAREAVRARDDVLQMVSHDLRNPISTIGMTSELLLEFSLDPQEQRKHLEIIRRTVNSMNRFIQDLLDVSQTESGQLAIETHSISPGALVKEACDLMRPLVEAESQRLEYVVPDDLPRVVADPSRIQQVLSNLLGNARKFAGAGGSIRLQVARSEEGVTFAVFDNGPGIPAEALPRLFDRHWRARETAHLGAGLGLAIAKGIVEAHGGRIWVESEVGEGTAFYFVIPVEPGYEQRQPATNDEESNSVGTVQSGA